MNSEVMSVNNKSSILLQSRGGGGGQYGESRSDDELNVQKGVRKRCQQESFILSSLATLYMIMAVVPLLRRKKRREVYQ